MSVEFHGFKIYLEHNTLILCKGKSTGYYVSDSIYCISAVSHTFKCAVEHCISEITRCCNYQLHDAIRKLNDPNLGHGLKNVDIDKMRDMVREEAKYYKRVISEVGLLPRNRGSYIP